MKVLHKYIAKQIIASVVFVLVAFLALFAFFDLIQEMPRLGRGSYQFEHALIYVLLGLPGYAYDLIPIAALIGTIYTLAQLGARSEFTIMRASGLSTAKAGWILARVGLVFVVLTFLFGELIAPFASDTAARMKLRLQGASVSQEFRSGYWTKDLIRENGLSGEAIGSRFLNVSQVTTEGQLWRVKLYEFDRELRLTAIVTASHADYLGENLWRLSEVTETNFSARKLDDAARVQTRNLPSKEMLSEITPNILSVLFSDPERMSALDLSAYTRHLAENKQSTERYEIAFWKKLFYPFAVFVMMALALPFAYLQVRSGGVSLKIFAGIMIGVGFHLINNLFSHLGLLNTWPPLLTAMVPSALFLLVALGSLWWVQK